MQGQVLLKGKVVDKEKQPVSFCKVVAKQSNQQVVASLKGVFEIEINQNDSLVFSSFGYQDKAIYVTLDDSLNYFNITLNERLSKTKTVVYHVDQKDDQRDQTGIVKLKPVDIKVGGMVSDDIAQVLATLPGVTVTSELSSQYAVRGGSFDENLVYVNDVLIYKPFLTRSGEQEGLSFVNSDLVEDVSFHAGGWQPRYGDKLSSVLSVTYKEPKSLEGSVTGGLLGGSVYLGGGSDSSRTSFALGARQKSTKYLLNTLPTSGEYQPRFIDFQSIVNIDVAKDFLTQRKDKLERKFTILNSFAKNDYSIIPSNRTTNFGTNQDIISLFIAFDGQETMSYSTYQGAIKYTHDWSQKHRSEISFSYLKTREREYQDVEGGYRLCDILPDNNNDGLNQCAVERGVGTLYNYARNRLNASILNLAYRGYYAKSDSTQSSWEYGFRATKEDINDYLYEYAYIDSSNFISITNFLESSQKLTSSRLNFYFQNSYWLSKTSKITWGSRIGYWDLNKQIIVSPRVQFSWKPKNDKRDEIYKASLGVYQQPPFYRELRNFDGELNTSLKAQQSIHAILGRDLNLTIWDRPFKLTSEVYYKYMTNIVPYDIDNVRLRYYAENSAKAFAYGADFRISGEFVKGDESWFSLGILSSQENVEGDGRGYLRRPTDRRVTFGVFFQDHLPNNPSIKMNMNLVYGTGLPFGPPNQPENRSVFTAPAYRRVDIGFSKLILFTDKEVEKDKFLKSFYIAFDILNVIAANNTISYIWIADVSGSNFAVPNTLSSRFFNLKFIAKF